MQRSFLLDVDPFGTDCNPVWGQITLEFYWPVPKTRLQSVLTGLMGKGAKVKHCIFGKHLVALLLSFGKIFLSGQIERSKNDRTPPPCTCALNALCGKPSKTAGRRRDMSYITAAASRKQHRTNGTVKKRAASISKRECFGREHKYKTSM